MAWQDIVSIVSLIISFIGLGLSIATLILTGKVKKAIYNEKMRVKFDDKKDEIKVKVGDLYNQLKATTSNPLGSPLEILFLDEYAQDFYDILVPLENFSNSWSRENRKVIESSMRLYKRISKGHTTIHTETDMLEYLTKIKHILDTDIF